MAKYETLASKAEAEIKEMLPPEEHAYRPWQLVNYDLEARTLQTTLDEISILMGKKAYLRPGYEVIGKKAFIPSLFVKISGGEFLLPELSSEKGKMLVSYDSVDAFSNAASSYIAESELNSVLDTEGLLDFGKLTNSRIFKYNYLRKEYQSILVEKINYIVKNREKLFTKNVETGNIYPILFTLMNVDEKLINLFHNFDFQYELPCVLIKNEDRGTFASQKAYVLMLLALLGFDIILASSKGYSDIENIINNEYYNIYYTNESINPKRTGPVKQKSNISFSKKILLIAAVCVFAGSAMLFGVIAKDGFAKDKTVKTMETKTSGESTKTVNGAVSESSNIPYGKDYLRITKVSPASKLSEGVETTFTIELEYFVGSVESARIDVGFNDNEVKPGNKFMNTQDEGNPARIFYPKFSVDVPKGSGKKVITLITKPVKWGYEPFQVKAFLTQVLSNGVDGRKMLNQYSYFFDL